MSKKLGRPKKYWTIFEEFIFLTGKEEISLNEWSNPPMERHFAFHNRNYSPINYEDVDMTAIEPHRGMITFEYDNRGRDFVR